MMLGVANELVDSKVSVQFEHFSVVSMSVEHIYWIRFV